MHFLSMDTKGFKVLNFGLKVSGRISVVHEGGFSNKGWDLIRVYIHGLKETDKRKDML